MKKLVFVLFFISVSFAAQSQCRRYEGKLPYKFAPEYIPWMKEQNGMLGEFDLPRGTRTLVFYPYEYERDTILADGRVAHFYKADYACYGKYPNQWCYVCLPDGVKLLIRCFAEYHYPTGMKPGVYNLVPDLLEVVGMDDCGTPIVFSADGSAGYTEPYIETRQESEPAPESSSGSCTITVNGRTIPLYGRVQVVSAAADFTVEVRSQAADLRVKTVSCCAQACGEWEFVSSAADFTVQFVSSAADLTIEYVSSFPGLR